MFDSQEQVLEVLRTARGLAETHWGTTNLDISMDDASGWMCASIAISSVAGECTGDLSVEAHAAFLKAAGQDIPDSGAAILEAVYAFNDAQLDKAPVIAAFDRAIAVFEAIDPTPEADALIEVMAACDAAAKVAAHHVVAERPDLPSREVERLMSSELFYAAQDAAEACLLSGVER